MDIDLSTLSLHDRADARRLDSAVEKVWRTAELVTQILSYLVRERIDLIVCSTVSKYFRALALPLLVQALDIRVPDARRARYFFRKNPKMADFVKYIRIRDDEQARRRSRIQARDGSIYVYDSKEERDSKWIKIADLFDLIVKGRSKEQLPLLDVTIASASISAFSVMLRRHKQAARRIAGLHFIPCRMPRWPTHTSDPDPHVKIGKLLTLRWRQLGLLLKKMCNTSANANPCALNRLHIGASLRRKDRNDWYNWWAPEKFWPSLKGILPVTVEDLALELPLTQASYFWAADLLESEWPHLRTFNLVVERPAVPLQSSIEQFLARHQHLENIEVTSKEIGPGIAISNAFPKLKRCHIKMDKDLASFLSQHIHTIRDLTVSHTYWRPEPLTSTRFRLAILDKEAFEKDALRLDVLRARADIAAGLVRSGVTVRHYEFDRTSSIKGLGLDYWLFPVREAAEAVTCLDIEVKVADLDSDWDFGGHDTSLRISLLPEDALPAGALPNLAELVLSWDVYRSQKHLSTVDGKALVARALATLKHQRFLRHLRLEHTQGLPFPSGPNAVLEVENSDQIPPRLEFITWRSLDENCTQRYRVMFPVQPDLATDVAAEGIATRRPPLKIRLQRLPHMVGSPIDEGGVWDRPQRWREGKTMFDHSKSPPELYA
ncbi:hypothetical protein CF319_g1165 [Tilletia indica]|nr:hypothetical protein CF319_g1165 [Tilletia indica]